MRALKFRGISISTGQFVYGGGIDTQRDTPMIINQGTKHPVLAESVAQYTGQNDLNDVEIYERDLVMWGHIDKFKENTPRKAIVLLNPALSFKTFNLGQNNHTFHFGRFAYAKVISKAMVVIGSLDTTPDLIK